MIAPSYPDVACDLWIISAWYDARAWQKATPAQREQMLAAQLDNETAGYGLPDDYTAGKRLHVFASDDCEVWLGCLDGRLINPERVCRLITAMVADLDMAIAIDLDGAFVVVLDGREVTGWYHSEVHHGATAAD